MTGWGVKCGSRGSISLYLHDLSFIFYMLGAPFHFFLVVFLLQRVISSDIKECVCRAPDTPYDGLCLPICTPPAAFLLCFCASHFF